MSNSILSLAYKSEFQGIYKKQTKKGTTFIARYTIHKKTRTQIIGYEKDGMTDYDAYRERLQLISSLKLASAVEKTNNKQLYFLVLFKKFIDFRAPFLSKNTIANYRSIYNQYISKDFKNKDVRNISSNDLQLYINKLLTYRRPATVEKIVSSFKIFYIYLQNNGIYKYNPSANLIMPKYDNKKYFSMTKKDIKKVMDYILEIETPIYKTLYFMLLHSRRIGELLSLSWNDIDFSNNIYYLDYKTNKSRKNQYYYLEEFQIIQLKKLRTLFPNSIYIFENPKTNLPLTYTSVFRVHKKLRIDLNMPNYTIHSMRHMVAFMIVNNGYSLEVTAKILGHTNITSTARYGVLEMKKAKSAYTKTFNSFFNTHKIVVEEV